MAWDTIDWAKSASTGSATEIAVLTPIKRGRVPQERRTFEERLAEVIESIDTRARDGLPIELSRIPAIHFGRLIIIRPEQFLYKARINVPDENGVDQNILELDNELAPAPLDPYVEAPGLQAAFGDLMANIDKYPSHMQPLFRKLAGFAKGRTVRNDPSLIDCPSMLLTIVSFDGDLQVYMRDIAESLGPDFDQIFENTIGYPETGASDFGTFWPWLRRHQIPVQFFLPVYPDMTVQQIKHLQMFKRRFDGLVAEIQDMDRAHLKAVKEKFDKFVAENTQIAGGFPTNGGLYIEPSSGGE